MSELREQTRQDLRRLLLERQSKHRVPAIYGVVARRGRMEWGRLSLDDTLDTEQARRHHHPPDARALVRHVA